MRRSSSHERPDPSLRGGLGAARFRRVQGALETGHNVPGLEFIDIHKSFGAVRALRGVSFSVSSGESHALMGENGAGKSTLLKVLAGIVTADRGEIRLDDRK